LTGLLDAVQANGGVINLSQRKLARKLGASRTTLQRALNDLAAAGAVMLETGKSGTRLALAG
jgi:DNA-binding GntR family transcriptional regulator